ncbi:hypothetical protein VTJ83DRAFT_5397 [Remersonia thermophila]|uniref:Bud22 domain-containing protein n=1 Tax=Remersonia thermophila TaxID=72144 RepID=A0ABR4D6T1_9PEZI
MPKRKRDSPSLDELFARHRVDVFHALKTAKGHERQRQSKRLSDKRTDPAKRARIENEIVVLKSLDLQQTAHAHLCSSLLRLKPVAALPQDRLPEALRVGVPKPELTEEERAALHNVTSSLYNRPEVKKVVEKAVEEMCRAMGVEAPKKGGRADGERKKDKKGKPEDEGNGSADSGGKEKREQKPKTDDKADAVAESAKKDKKSKAKDGADDAARSGKEKHSKAEAREDEGDDERDESADEIDEEEEEKAVSELEKLLGLGSDEEEDSDEEVLVKGRPRKPSSKELDPMEITTEEEDDESEEDDEDGEIGDEDESSEGGGQLTKEEESSDSFFDFSAAENETSSGEEDQSSQSDQDDSDSDSSSSASRSPPAKKPKKEGKKEGKKENVWALPTLMAGYISGSESASEIDDAPARKNRRGQRARQAIWEKKYGEKAKHLQKQARDAGWDLKRGAVEPGAKPWKQGIRNPLLDKGKNKGAAAEGGDSGPTGGNAKGRGHGPAGRRGPQAGKDSKPNQSHQGPPKKAPAPRARDDTGPLHPSWEAKRKAKEKMLTAPFQGKKITFD